MATEGIGLERRLANFRAALARAEAGSLEVADSPPAVPPRELARRMAVALDGRLIETAMGGYVLVEWPALPLAVDRARLAALPGHPPADAPIVCLDTETTGLGTAAGTYAFLVGLGWWEAGWFRTVQLLLPDQAAEPALLAAIARHVPPDAWLVSYNGRGFDWPLLVTRFRMARQGPPPHAGHVDLLPIVRRIFRHRLPDARLRTVEAGLLDMERHDDVEGWEIPGRYLDFLRTGLAAPLRAVARHNAEDVRSLGRLLCLVESSLGDAAVRRLADPGDVAGLARLYLRARQFEAALECLEAALAPRHRRPSLHGRLPHDEPVDDWWSPQRAPDYGGTRTWHRAQEADQLSSPWSEERLLVERAHVLRRLGRTAEAAAGWADLSVGTSRLAAVAAVELAKLREHRLGDLRGALEACRRAWTILDRRRRLGRPEPRLEADLLRRGERLRRRLRTAPLDAREQPAAILGCGPGEGGSPTGTLATGGVDG